MSDTKAAPSIIHSVSILVVSSSAKQTAAVSHVTGPVSPSRPSVNRLPNLTPVLPHLGMLLSLDGCRSDCRPVRGGIIARRIGGTGDVAECPSHAAAAPVPGSPASATPSAVRGMIVSAALRLSDRNKRCTIVCCGGPNCSGRCSTRRPRIASAVRRGSAASQRSMSARC